MLIYNEPLKYVLSKPFFLWGGGEGGTAKGVTAKGVTAKGGNS